MGHVPAFTFPKDKTTTLTIKNGAYAAILANDACMVHPFRGRSSKGRTVLGLQQQQQRGPVAPWPCGLVASGPTRWVDVKTGSATHMKSPQNAVTIFCGLEEISPYPD
jgi:hypothetical protein